MEELGIALIGGGWTLIVFGIGLGMGKDAQVGPQGEEGPPGPAGGDVTHDELRALSNRVSNIERAKGVEELKGRRDG